MVINHFRWWQSVWKSRAYEYVEGLIITAHRNHFNYKYSLNTDDQQRWPYGLNFDRNFYWILNELVDSLWGSVKCFHMNWKKFYQNLVEQIYFQLKTQLCYAVYVCYSRNKYMKYWDLIHRNIYRKTAHCTI